MLLANVRTAVVLVMLTGFYVYALKGTITKVRVIDCICIPHFHRLIHCQKMDAAKSSLVWYLQNSFIGEGSRVKGCNFADGIIHQHLGL